MHAEYLESSPHVSWEVFPGTLAVICEQDQVKWVTLIVTRFGSEFQPKIPQRGITAIPSH